METRLENSDQLSCTPPNPGSNLCFTFFILLLIVLFLSLCLILLGHHHHPRRSGSQQFLPRSERSGGFPREWGRPLALSFASIGAAAAAAQAQKEIMGALST